ncbi:hypothetical protein E2C01_041452 [Portunus trituberculatus]|uniref:Uncharacterized protein n=1 Tax=Portunus trituberculatus TaxID=210409 RepID=A0A5B7FRY0_PORTR|nr:hypothetical protein [Portunus trituberculatus]
MTSEGPPTGFNSVPEAPPRKTPEYLLQESSPKEPRRGQGCQGCQGCGTTKQCSVLVSQLSYL